jgi:riboflavin kinase/FMN adenylyltransferase
LTYEVVVARQVEVDGRPISSSEIRRRIESGDLAGAAELLGRPYAIAGTVDAAGRITTPAPVALPPPGRYATDRGALVVAGDGLRLHPPAPLLGRQRLAFRGV